MKYCLNEVKACDIIDGPGKEWIIKHEEPVPDLDCYGDLSWVDVTAGEAVTGTITVENMGEPLSMLDWGIESYPTWGTWTFVPSSGTGLTPVMGALTITVEVVAPNEEDKEFTGEVKIVNSEDPSDYCIIPVSLVTPVSQDLIESQNMHYQNFIKKLMLGTIV